VGGRVDAAVIRAHHHGAGGRHAPPGDVAEAVLGPVGSHGELNRMTRNPRRGSSRRGNSRHGNRIGRHRDVPETGKRALVHIGADTRCRPAAPVVTASAHAWIAFDAAMANLRIERPGRGRRRTRPDRVLADRAYSSVAIRTELTAEGSRPDPQQGQRDHRLSPPAQQGWATGVRLRGLQERNVVETTINRLHQSRTVATRYDKMSSSTAAPSTPPQSGSGCQTRPERIHGTRPS
jgi:hypothetical protein